MIKDIHIFSPGVQTSAQGVTREFTKDDLKQVAESYTPDIHEAPIRVGHEDNDKVPAWGWVKGVKMKGDDLVAEVEFSPLMEDYIQNGLYKKVSASFYSPESKINPEPGKWSLRHVAMLGAQPPAVKGLKGFAYSEESEGEGVLDFAVTLTPDQVFDKELGPTLKVDQAPMELLKEKLSEAKSEMTTDQQAKQELEALEEEKLEAENPAEEYAESMKKKAPAGDMGAEDAEEEDDDDADEEDFAGCGGKKKSYKEGKDEAMHGEPTFEPSKKKRGTDNLNASDVGVKETPASKIFEAGEANEEEFGEAEALEDGKPKSLKAPAAKGMSGLPAEESEGEGPVASKVKKSPKDGECCEDGEEEYDEDEALHKEGYVDKETEPVHGDDGMEGRPKSTDEQPNDQTGRGQVGKAGEAGTTGRSKTAKSSEQPDGRKKKGSDDGEAEASRSKTAKSSEQPDGRKKTGKAGKSGETGRGESGEYAGGVSGTGSAVKSGKVHVEYVGKKGGAKQPSTSNFAELEERLAQLEAANAKLVAEKIEAQRSAHRMQLEEFAESLYSHGKLTPAVIAQEELVDYMEGLEYGTLEFAEGENAATKLMTILAALPSQVSFSEIAGGISADEIPTENLDPHERALRMSKEEGVDYAEALKKALFS